MTAHETGEPFRQLCGGARARPRAGGGRRGGLPGQRPHDPGQGRDQGTRPGANDGEHAERLGRSRLPNPDVIRGTHAREGGGAIFFVVGNNHGKLTIKDSALDNDPSRGFFTAGYPNRRPAHAARKKVMPMSQLCR
jgi:hypothetical protein